MSQAAFPPSSPLYYEEHSDFESDNIFIADDASSTKPQNTFNIKSKLYNKSVQFAKEDDFDGYPTPNPSSSIGGLGSSSPIHEDNLRVDSSEDDEDDEGEEEQKALDLQQEKEFQNKLEESGPRMVQFTQPLDASYHTIEDDEYVDVADEAKKLKKTRISSKKKIKKIKIPYDGQEVTFGRSKMCDVVVSDTLNLASRKHASVHFDRHDNVLVFECFGVNSMEVYIPYGATVKRLGGDDRYELIPKDTAQYRKLQDKRYEELVALGLTKFPRSLVYPDGGVRIMILSNEALRVPKSSVVMDIRGASCIIEVGDEHDPDMTDEEDIHKFKALTGNVILYKVGDVVDSKEPSLNPATQIDRVEKIMGSIPQSAEKKPPVKLQAHDVVSARSENDQKNMSTSSDMKVPESSLVLKSSEDSLPKKPILNDGIQSKKPKSGIFNNNSSNQLASPLKFSSHSKLNSSRSTVSLDKIKQMMKVNEEEDKHEQKYERIQEEKLIENKDKENDNKLQSKKRPRPHNPHKQKDSEEKDTKKQKIHYDYQDPKTLIDAVNSDEAKKQQLLAEVSDLKDIKKVLINHLAFSRIASTPLTQLRGISKKVEFLGKKTVRLVLSDVKCVGVIYRKGKDAAGKPLDEEYYYDIEKDDDDDRVQLVNSLKGGSSLRSCRKTHKQYYWKRPPPLPRY
ncbi:Tos4 protein [Saccharomycopsis crataegensis]|uniref:Tos4 protein n=1 Tax=Saccharomycopsis crataegensis TaxID=43959 RepID=A0AAV5QHC6_9ASCO|nr:Tos4 protein [Saccharomycopsis crataegensis]